MQTFKEPALDMVWAELEDLTPLVRCLSNESLVTLEPINPYARPLYSLKKPLEQAEWDIILRCARRVQKLPRLNTSFGLAPDCIKILSNPPGSIQSIFQSLRIVEIHDPSAMVSPLVRHLISPTVTNITFWHVGILGSALASFGEGCPHVTDFCGWEWGDGDAISALICHWKNLRSAQCEAALNINALFHLSRLPNLHFLCFKVHDAVVDQIQATRSSTSILTFAALRDLTLRSPLLSPVTGLLRRFRVPILDSLCVDVDSCPIALDLTSLFMGFQESLDQAPLNALLVHIREYGMVLSPQHIITLNRLRPLSVFANIKDITLNIPWRVDLNECELLTLASSWPHLEIFQMSDRSGWTPSSGITPGGFLRLLAMCRSLRVFRFKFDTRGYTDIPQGDPWHGFRMRTRLSVHLLDSPIEEASIYALGVFFHVAPFPEFELAAYWDGNFIFRMGALWLEHGDLYRDRWWLVRDLAHDLWKERAALRRSLETPSSPH